MNRTEYYRSIYGATASVKQNKNGTFHLNVSVGPTRVHSKTYNTYRSAKIALGQWSDSWEKRVMNTYEIMIINEYGHIIHHHYFESFSRDYAEDDARKTKEHFPGCDWKILKIK
jgi:hypothetical protein